MSTIGTAAWNKFKKYNQTTLDQFQPYLSLRSLTGINDSTNLTYDNVLFLKDTFKQRKDKEAYNIYGSIESVSIQKNDLKAGKTEVKVSLKTFTQNVFDLKFFQDILTIGTKWVLTYGWYVGSVAEEFRDEITLTVWNFQVGFNNDGTYTIDVDMTDDIMGVLIAMNTVVSGKELVTKLEAYPRPLNIFKLVTALNEMISGTNNRIDILEMPIDEANGNIIEFELSDDNIDTVTKAKLLDIKYISKIPLKRNMIMDLISRTSSLSKILQAITDSNYYEKIIGLKTQSTGTTTINFKLATDANGSVIYVYNKYSANKFYTDKYYITYGSDTSLMENLSYTTEYSPTVLATHQASLIKQVGNVSENSFPSGWVFESNEGKTGIAKLVQNMQGKTASKDIGTANPTSTSQDSSAKGSPSPVNQTKKAGVRFIDIINSYFSLATITVWGIPGISLFKRVILKSSIPTNLVGEIYHVIGINHHIDKNTFKTTLDLRLLSFGEDK